MIVSVVGAGLIGKERLKALKILSVAPENNIEIGTVVDINKDLLNLIQIEYDCKIATDIDVMLNDRPDWVFICTPHHDVIDIVRKFFSLGCNILVEKPLGRTFDECRSILSGKPTNCKLAVGFNYRFFSGVKALIEDSKNGKFGNIISVNMILGHGNSPGMEKSWKLDPVQCGGGSLLDPGIHLLDLVLCLAVGPVSVNGGCSWSGFWNTGIEEESHVILSDSVGVIYNIQSSLNRWRSIFNLSINGTEGYGVVDGRGKSYGPQSYRTGKRWAWLDGVNQKESEVVVIDRDNVENSFFNETASILGFDLLKSKSPYHLQPCNEEEALNTMSLYSKCQNLLINNNRV